MFVKKAPAITAPTTMTTTTTATIIAIIAPALNPHFGGGGGEGTIEDSEIDSYLVA